MATTRNSNVWFLTGLFLTTLTSLALEILNTRLLSVMTWYHLSFFAVSTAMFGMAAGGVRVYVGGDRFQGDAAKRELARNGAYFACSVPLAHLVTLCIPIQVQYTVTTVAALALSTLVMALPFYLSGILVAIALTRIPGPSGRIYAVDLAGAALGCLLVVPTLEILDLSSSALACGAVAAVAAACFHRFAGQPHERRWLAVAVALAIASGLNSGTLMGLQPVYSKGKMPPSPPVDSFWSIHGRVTVWYPSTGKPAYWGAGRGSENYRVVTIPTHIDGAAGTRMTRWDGDPSSLEWVQHDVTSVPYHLRKGGNVAVIGVGGGRDLLTALWAGSRKVTGVEINRAFVEMLSGPYRSFTKIVDRPEVELVHDDGRSYMTRSKDRYDILQMSLVDTFAATGAGAFTLSENGLYTVDAWRVFLSTLAPGGIFSVSRWYSPDRASETSRLVSLATAALLDQGSTDPAAQLVLMARLSTATLLASNEPFGPTELETLRRVAKRFGFRILMAPGVEPADPLLGSIASSRSLSELDAAVANTSYDYTPPTDQRPYFFNILKPGSIFSDELVAAGYGVLVEGNLMATRTLALLWVLSLVLVVAIVIGPLLRLGLPRMEATSFGYAVSYFALIGLGFMFVQIPLIQRYSVYLGHPVYAVAVILFSMILATGAGSLISDRIPLERSFRWAAGFPLSIALLLVLNVSTLQWIIDTTIQFGLLARCAIVVLVVSVTALPLGFCFPLGLRLVRRISDDATPWMWGVNGACGVLATVSAVAISMWGGIDVALLVAALFYGALTIPSAVLWRRGAGT
ncbi:hypothetical protein MK489_24295 [Myxococcota bacterium]|nr:hypothetical protein [Myxococcota bacterium]